MDTEAGMVFLWPEGKKRVLYMRNTYVALDAGWFDGEGHLMEVSPLKPLDETWVWSTSDQIHFAVEMNLGWYEKHCPGSSAGGKLAMDMDALAQAVQNHGADPAAFIGAQHLPKVEAVLSAASSEETAASPEASPAASPEGQAAPAASPEGQAALVQWLR